MLAPLPRLCDWAALVPTACLRAVPWAKGWTPLPRLGEGSSLAVKFLRRRGTFQLFM
jgi:hypothetical protein